MNYQSIEQFIADNSWLSQEAYYYVLNDVVEPKGPLARWFFFHGYSELARNN